MKNIVVIILFLLSFQQHYAQSPSAILSKSETDSLIANYCIQLNQTYFDKEQSKKIEVILKNKLKGGEFYNVTGLTDKLSLLLRDITKDNHFYIGVIQPEISGNEILANIAQPEPENKNGGFYEVKIIDNTIGYIKWNEFIADDEAFRKAIAVLEFVKGCKYLIFDLSECAGGDGRAGSFINSHLFKGMGYQDLLQKKCSGETAWHQSEVPYNYTNGPKFYDAQVFVITSKHTASAAEYFALTIKEMKRGLVLGDTTAGAGNPSVMVQFGNYFACIPICEIVTNDGKSIEGKGVIPNLKLTTDDCVKETVEYIKKQK